MSPLFPITEQTRSSSAVSSLVPAKSVGILLVQRPTHERCLTRTWVRPHLLRSLLVPAAGSEREEERRSSGWPPPEAGWSKPEASAQPRSGAGARPGFDIQYLPIKG